MVKFALLRYLIPERVSTKSFVVLIIGNSKSFHLGAQGTFNTTLASVAGVLCLPHIVLVYYTNTDTYPTNKLTKSSTQNSTVIVGH